MNFISQEQISSKVLDHLGLVSATLEKLGLCEKIDQLIPVCQEKGAKMTMGQRVCAMILNGLGFMDDRLYLFPEFLQNKPVESLLGKGLKAKDFNDDSLGRALDSIYAYGSTLFFSRLAFEIGIEQKLLGRSSHFDTSSVSLEGDYAESDVSNSSIKSQAKVESGISRPKYGHSKDHRPDLKQMVINLATTGSAGFPIWMEAHSGNASDKKVLHQAAVQMQAFCKQLQEAPSFMYVGDSAIYESCVKEAGDLLWLSRVPENHKAAKELLRRSDNEFCWTELPHGYRMCVMETRYRSIHQRWVMISSEQAYKREIITLNKRIIQEHDKAEKALRLLGHQLFSCEKDARKAGDKLGKKLKYHSLDVRVSPQLTYPKKGRPAKDAKSILKGYQVRGELLPEERKITPHRYSKGRFILATNQLDRTILPDADILAEYKQQGQTERGFRFLKDDTFEVSSIFLKKPERIVALMTVMVLCLMVYGCAQHDFRKALSQNKETIPNQLKKETSTPTMKWVYRLFHGIHVVSLNLKEGMQEIVINLNSVTEKIIRLFGSKATQIYGLAPT